MTLLHEQPQLFVDLLDQYNFKKEHLEEKRFWMNCVSPSRTPEVRWSDSGEWLTFSQAFKRLYDDDKCRTVFKVTVGSVHDDGTNRILHALLPKGHAKRITYDAGRLEEDPTEISHLLLVAAATVLNVRIQVGVTSPSSQKPITLGSSSWTDYPPRDTTGGVKQVDVRGPLLIIRAFECAHYLVPMSEGVAKNVLAVANHKKYFGVRDDGNLGAPYALAPDVSRGSCAGPSGSDSEVLLPTCGVVAMNMDRFADHPASLSSMSHVHFPGETRPIISRAPYTCATPILVEPMWSTAATYQVTGNRLVLVVHPDSYGQLVDAITVMALAMQSDAPWSRDGFDIHACRGQLTDEARMMGQLQFKAMKFLPPPSVLKAFEVRHQIVRVGPGQLTILRGDAVHADFSMSQESVTMTSRVLTRNWFQHGSLDRVLKHWQWVKSLASRPLPEVYKLLEQWGSGEEALRAAIDVCPLDRTLSLLESVEASLAGAHASVLRLGTLATDGAEKINARQLIEDTISILKDGDVNNFVKQLKEKCSIKGN
jgi:hypothetical protein